MSSHVELIKNHITQKLLADPTIDLELDQDLLLSGMLDSINVVKLVSFLESQFHISIAPEDVVIEHFASINQIMEYLKSRDVV